MLGVVGFRFVFCLFVGFASDLHVACFVLVLAVLFGLFWFCVGFVLNLCWLCFDMCLCCY